MAGEVRSERLKEMGMIWRNISCNRLFHGDNDKIQSLTAAGFFTSSNVLWNGALDTILKRTSPCVHRRIEPIDILRVPS
jgi:hypothetical protein